MQIAGYLKTSLIEWPGKICSVIFTPGCNFRCPFCHNRELVEMQRCKDAKMQRCKEEEVLKDLNKRKKWVDAVVITGGEPTIQEGLDKFLKSIKKLKFLTMIHTNGTRPDALASILNFKFQILNFIAMDLKGDFENYEKYTGIQKSKIKNQNEKLKLKIQETMRLIINSGVEYEFRTTVVPGLHNLGNLSKLAKQMQELYAGQKENLRSKEAKKQRSKEKNLSETLKLCVSESSPKWYLQQFRPMNTLDKKFLKVKPYSKEEMEGFQKELRKIIPGTLLRGV